MECSCINIRVGKNKIVDRLLMLLDRPREYVQLHVSLSGLEDTRVLLVRERSTGLVMR